MVYQLGNMLLQVTQELFRGKVNDVLVCQDIQAVGKTYYTVLVVKNHDTARRLLEVYEAAGSRARGTYVNSFTWQENYLMVFDYQAARPLDKFFFSEIRTPAECEKLCINIIMECISSGVPYPVLYLQLAQDQIHIQKDGNAALGYNLDLSGFTGLKSEKDCATLCAKKLFLLLGQTGKTKITSYRLLELKNQREGYARFTDLYKDIRATAIPLEKESFLDKVRVFFHRNQDRIFRMLLIVCVTFGIFALLMLLSQLIFADIPFLRLFVNSFKQIGTESLLK